MSKLLGEERLWIASSVTQASIKRLGLDPEVEAEALGLLMKGEGSRFLVPKKG